MVFLTGTAAFVSCVATGTRVNFVDERTAFVQGDHVFENTIALAMNPQNGEPLKGNAPLH